MAERDIHTPGTMKVFKPLGKAKRGIGPSPDLIIAATTPCKDHQGHHHSKANARRLVAAWNACQGIQTEILETFHNSGVDVVATASMNARADEAEALLAEAEKFIRAEYECKLDCVCLKDEDGKPQRDTVDNLAREHVEEYEALLAKLKARSAP